MISDFLKKPDSKIFSR